MFNLIRFWYHRTLKAISVFTGAELCLHCEVRDVYCGNCTQDGNCSECHVYPVLQEIEALWVKGVYNV